jgi:outer membrane protein assembly factor BamB
MASIIAIIASIILLLIHFFHAAIPPIIQAQTLECDSSDTTNWCQVAHDPQRTGFTPATLGSNFRVAWTHPFQPDRVYPQNQAVVYHGKVIVGTEGANGQVASVYAFNEATGAQIWKHELGTPIMSSVATQNGRVFVSAMDGAIYALDETDGHQIWKTQLSTRFGFSASPLLAQNKLFVGGRDGLFYALDLTDGHKLWDYNVGHPILQTAAYDTNRVYFGATDLSLYALNSSDGSLSWQSPEMTGFALKDFWPVINQGIVYVRPIGRRTNNYDMPGVYPLNFPFSWFGSASDYAWLTTNGPTIAAGNLTSIPDVMNPQTTLINSYIANPSNFTKNLYTYNSVNGQDVLTGPDWPFQSHSGTPGSSCINRDHKLIVPVMLARSGWGVLDPTAQRIVDILFDNTGKWGGTITDTPAGMGNGDENLQVTCTQNFVLSFHWMEANANYTGAFNLDTRHWTMIVPGYTNRQMSSNTQGGIGNPASVANGRIFHISWHELIARTTN